MCKCNVESTEDKEHPEIQRQGLMHKLVGCLRLSHLDYSNSILYGLPKSVIQQM